jgi:hypothetical protein
METLLQQIPETGSIQLTIQITSRFNYSAQAARRLARRFVADEISYLLRVGEPTLVAGESICWRMPIELALPSYGAVGQVGAVDVDIENGRILLTAEQIETIRNRSEALGERYASAGAPS